MRRSSSALFVGLLAGTALIAAPQNPPTPTFREGVELIQLDVSVLDMARRPVADLNAVDFTVFIDGKPRPVVAFKAVTLPPPAPPPTAPWTRDVDPDVATNIHAAGRIVVIAIDDGSFYQVDAPTPGSAGDSTPVVDLRAVQKARESARRVVDELGAEDLAAVVFTQNNHSTQGLTLDRQRLLAAIDHAALAPGPHQIDPDDPYLLKRGDCMCGLCSIEALRALMDSLQGMPEQRKIVTYISAGVPIFAHVDVPYDLRANSYPLVVEACNTQRKKSMDDVFRRAALANVTIQSIDPKGLITNSVGPDNLGSMRVEFLRTMAETTGGRAIVNNNEMQEDVAAVLAESSTYYLLGVESPGVGKDGQHHAIQVRVNRPDVEVRTRKGYYDATAQERALASRAPTGLDSTVSRPVPQGSIPLVLGVVPVAGTDGRPALALVLNVTEPVSEIAPGTTRRESVEVMATAIAQDGGKGYGTDRKTLAIDWNASNNPTGQYEVLSRLAVPPGRYEVRVAVKAGDGRMASVYASAEVPNFDDDLTLSGLALSSAPALKAGGAETLAGLMTLVPTARRAFYVDDRVTAFMRIYQGDAVFAPATVLLRITDTNNDIVLETTDHVDGARTARGSAADFQAVLPINTLATGEYLLTVDVVAGNKKAQRAMRFTVN